MFLNFKGVITNIVNSNFRPYRFLQKKEYWNAVNSTSMQFVDAKNDQPLPPLYKLYFETENHYATIGLRLRDNCIDEQSILELDTDLFQLTYYRLGYVRVISQDGFSQYIYKRSNDILLSSDEQFENYIRLLVNYRDEIKIVTQTNLNDPINKMNNALSIFLRKYFLDSLGREIKVITFNSSWSKDCKKYCLKTKQHPKYSNAHNNFSDTEIEKRIEQLLLKNKIIFTKQTEFFIDGIKYSVPDFILGNTKILIYCYGIEFHKDPQRIIKDKAQDRTFQLKGYIVLRFSGSEIISQIDDCEKEILTAINIRTNIEPAKCLSVGSMKDVTIYSFGSCDATTRKGSYYASLEYCGNYKYVSGYLDDVTTNRCIIVGVIEAIRKLKEPCAVKVITGTLIGIKKWQKNRKGVNADLITELHELAWEKKCLLTFEAIAGQRDEIIKMAKGINKENR